MESVVMREGSQIHLSRRRLIQLGGGATAALYLPSFASVAVASGVPASLKRSSYASLVGASFTSDAGALTLTAVSDLARAASDPSFAGRDDAFALSLSGPTGSVLQSGIHTLSNSTVGSFDIFISPVDDPGADQAYEVVVDRSVPIGLADDVAPQPLAQSNGAAGVAEVEPSSRLVSGGGTAGHVALVEFASVARRGGLLTVDVRVARGKGIVAVAVSLSRGGTQYARASGRLRGGRAVRLTMRRLRKVRAGHYQLRVTTTDSHGRRSASTRSVSIH
jgi:hypothetical protein